ncbi:MAG: hypothetical protein LBD42_00100 [Desulfovibrio sp.]|nr:hypothetical protein [Desulfovibrio sp.]
MALLSGTVVPNFVCAVGVGDTYITLVDIHTNIAYRFHSLILLIMDLYRIFSA